MSCQSASVASLFSINCDFSLFAGEVSMVELCFKAGLEWLW